MTVRRARRSVDRFKTSLVDVFSGCTVGISPLGKKDSGEGGVTVEYGTVKALHAIAGRIGLIDIVNRAAPKRNGLPVGELVFIMAANRVLDPRPKYTIPDWCQRTYLPEILGIDLPPDSAYQTLTRCLDYLTDDVQMEIEMALAGRVMESFHLKPESFIYDVTSTFVEGEGGTWEEADEERRRGKDSPAPREEPLREAHRLAPRRRERNEAALKEEEILDGRYWLVTTLDHSPKEVLEIYRSKDAVERAFRITKETIKIRPIWNRTEEHIKAHLFVCFIAYLLYSLLEIEARKDIPGITGMKTLDRLRRFTESVKRPRFLPSDEDIALLSRVSRSR